jgi:hypothetical protein
MRVHIKSEIVKVARRGGGAPRGGGETFTQSFFKGSIIVK